MDEARFRRAERRLWDSLGVSVVDRVVELGRLGTTLRVQEAGEGLPVVFIHGGSSAGTSWATLVARLQGLRCLLIDRPGCGLSPPLAIRLHDVRSLDQFAEDLVQDVLDAVGLDRATLVTTSFGGYLGLHAAAKLPSRIERLVEFGWPVGAPVGRTPLMMRIAMVPLVGRIIAFLPANERAARAALRSAGLGRALDERRISREAIAWFASLLRDTDTLLNELRSGPRFITPLRGINENVLLSDEALSAVSVPVHFLWGTNDTFGGSEVARAFAARVPGSRLELVDGGGHAVWMDEPDGAARTIRQALATGHPPDSALPTPNSVVG
jgi:pimeloyl-ACP methyl ester carboxylesterase